MAVRDLNKIIDNHSFEKASGRKVGEEDKNSFARKGLVGDWRNYFDAESLKTLELWVGDRHRKLGYV